MRTKKFLAIAAAIPLSAVLIYFLFDRGYLRFNYPSRKTYPIWGIDVSHHQGKIDWPKVKTEKIDFVYIKATEGGDFRDPNFKKNWSEAQAAGFKVGAYHFFTLCRRVQDQIANFLSEVPEGKSHLPPALDLEFMGNCKESNIKVSLPGDVNIFIEALAKRYEKEPVLYVTNEFYDAYLKDQPLKSSRIWIRSIFGSPKIPVPWILWQFANRGRLDGINTPVDINVFNGGLDQFSGF